MFTNKKAEKTALDLAIDELLDEMARYSGTSDEYNKLTDQLTTLYSIKETEHQIHSKKNVSADTLAIVGGNLLGIVLIVGHERAHVVTSKALTLLTKLR